MTTTATIALNSVKINTLPIEITGKMLALSQDRLSKAMQALADGNMNVHRKALQDMEIINRALTQQNLKLWMSIVETEMMLNVDREGMIDEQLQNLLDAVENDMHPQHRSGLITPTDLTAPGASLVD